MGISRWLSATSLFCLRVFARRQIEDFADNQEVSPRGERRGDAKGTATAALREGTATQGTGQLRQERKGNTGERERRWQRQGKAQRRRGKGNDGKGNAGKGRHNYTRNGTATQGKGQQRRNGKAMPGKGNAGERQRRRQERSAALIYR